MGKITAAFATDNGKSFINRLFEDANYYMIYEISKDKMKFIDKIKNTTNDLKEETHADPKKAKGVTGLLKNEGVIGKIFIQQTEKLIHLKSLKSSLLDMTFKGELVK